MTAYFAADGSYGDATGLVIIDTSNLTEENWQAIEEASDEHRAQLAASLAVLATPEDIRRCQADAYELAIQTLVSESMYDEARETNPFDK